MATKSSNRSFLSGDQSAAKIRRDFIDRPMAGAKLSLLGSGLELLNLMSVLPDAFIASQRRELERVKESGAQNDERIATLNASIEQASVLRTTVERGEVRIERALGSLGDNNYAFHGFVSDADLQPVGGLTVRLNVRESGKRGVTTTTEDDGYFRVPLGSKTGSEKEWRNNVGEISFSDRLNMFGQRWSAAKASANADASATPGSRTLAQVEILKGTSVIYTDPNGVPTDDGSVYREYVVSVGKRRSESEYGDFAGQALSEDVEVAQTVASKRAAKKRSSAKKASKK